MDFFVILRYNQGNSKNVPQIFAIFYERISHQIRSAGCRGQMVCLLDGARAVPFRAGRARALYHRYPAAQCDRRAAHGPHAEQYNTGYIGAPRTNVRQERLLGAGHRPRRHQYGGQGRGQTGRGRHKETGPEPRGIPEACVGLDAQIRRHHPEAAAHPGRLVRLGTHRVHHGREAVQVGDPRVQQAV